MNMTYLRIFLDPLSFETLNRSKSDEPTSAPENEFDDGAIMKDTTINTSDNANRIHISIDIMPLSKVLYLFLLKKLSIITLWIVL